MLYIPVSFVGSYFAGLANASKSREDCKGVVKKIIRDDTLILKQREWATSVRCLYPV